MWCVTVAVGNIPWALMFKTEDRAKEIHETIRQSFIDGAMGTEVEDDFGQSLFVAGNSFGGSMLEDMDKSKLAHIERALHHARMQQEGQKLAAADATLRQGQHGPSIIQPMTNGYPRQ